MRFWQHCPLMCVCVCLHHCVPDECVGVFLCAFVGKEGYDMGHKRLPGYETLHTCGGNSKTVCNFNWLCREPGSDLEIL